MSVKKLSGECHRTPSMTTFVQVMAWYHQETSHYLSQCWLRSMSPYLMVSARQACLSQSYVLFTGFKTDRCLYLWWQIKQSAEIGAVVSLYAQYSPLPLLPLQSIYILYYIETYWCSEKQTEAGDFAKIVDFSAVEKHLADILIPGLVTWTALPPTRHCVDCFIVSKLQCGSSSFDQYPPLNCLLNKHSGAWTSQRDCKAWPC